MVPAVDLIDKCVVRVEQGDPNRKKIYSDDPLKTIHEFERHGARLVHVVDLNAAIRNDRETNRDVITRILDETKISAIQIAGGIRSAQIVKELLQKGAQRIVISSIAYSRPDEAYEILQTFGAGRIVLALDYDGSGLVRTSGWAKSQGERVINAVSRFSKLGFNYFLTTAVERDGLLQGPDLVTLEKLRKENINSARLIASGGVASRDDLVHLSKIGLDEAIVGKAIYEEKVPLSIVSEDI